MVRLCLLKEHLFPLQLPFYFCQIHAMQLYTYNFTRALLHLFHYSGLLLMAFLLDLLFVLSRCI